MIILNRPQPVNIQLLHEELEALAIPDFNGVSAYEDGRETAIEVYVGTADENGEFTHRSLPQQELAQIIAVVQSHDQTKQSAVEKAKAQREQETQAALERLSQLPDQTIQDLLTLVQAT